MTHDCPTGHHTTPHYSCYSHHGCRCDGCRQQKVARNRYDRWAGDIPDEPDWMDRLAIVEQIAGLAETVERLQRQIDSLQDRPNKVIRHKLVECNCDDPEPLPERLPAGPLVDLVESRRRPLSDQLHDETLKAAFYRARKSGWLTFDAADRLAIALGHTLETVWPPDVLSKPLATATEGAA